MIIKNLFRRKGRTLLTILGISVGVAAIIGLGAMADGLEAGYNALLAGSKADLVLSQPDSFDISYSAVDESLGPDLAAMSEVSAVSGMLQGFVSTDSVPFLFVFGYPLDSFVLSRFQIIDGAGLDSREALHARGTPVLLGSAASESLNKTVGETIHLGGRTYRVVGIYETGDAFEDGGALLELKEAQEVLGKPRQVSLFYIQLKDPSLRERLSSRAERLWPDYEISGTDDFADKQILSDALRGYVWVIAGMAILIGGVGMMNAQLMAVMERTREIGVLRAVGWKKGRVLRLILGESVFVGLVGGALGVLLGWLSLIAFSDIMGIFGANAASLSPTLIQTALITVLTLGLVGGFYPAWHASRLEPIEALRYEGGTSSQGVRRLPVGGMAAQSLWQRTTRTLLTLGAIGLTVGSILVLDGVMEGSAALMTNMALGADAQIVLRQADVADTSLSAIDEKVGKKVAALPEVKGVSGFALGVFISPDSGEFLILLGYAPNELAIRRFTVVDGDPLTNNRQILLGKTMAASLSKKVGDTLEVGGSRYRVVGIFEAGGGFEELGGIISLRDAQNFLGRPRKVTMYFISVDDPAQAPALVDKINAEFPEVHAALSGEFVDQLPDMQNADAMIGGISLLAIIVGGVSVMNTMLMAVLERTREIGVMRALGWRNRAVLGLILREALLLGILGGLVGIAVAFSLAFLLSLVPSYGEMIDVIWTVDGLIRALVIALLLGVIGGLYPAIRATRLQPIEALRYE